MIGKIENRERNNDISRANTQASMNEMSTDTHTHEKEYVSNENIQCVHSTILCCMRVDYKRIDISVDRCNEIVLSIFSYLFPYFFIHYQPCLNFFTKFKNIFFCQNNQRNRSTSLEYPNKKNLFGVRQKTYQLSPDFFFFCRLHSSDVHSTFIVTDIRCGETFIICVYKER